MKFLNIFEYYPYIMIYGEKFKVQEENIDNITYYSLIELDIIKETNKRNFFKRIANHYGFEDYNFKSLIDQY